MATAQFATEIPSVRHAKRCTMKRTFNNIFSISILGAHGRSTGAKRYLLL